MQVRETLRINIWLIIGTAITDLVATITELVLFSWIAIGLSTWLFLNLYWLVICYIGYFYLKNSGRLPFSNEVEGQSPDEPTKPTNANGQSTPSE